MKILHTVPGWPPERSGEQELYVQRLARAQVADGHEVAVAAGTATDRSTTSFLRANRSEPDDEGIAVFRISPGTARPDRWNRGSAPHVARAFGELLDEVRPDVVHVHHWQHLTRSLVRRAARAGVPVVLTLGDAAATCPRRERERQDTPFCELAPAAENCARCVPSEAWISSDVLAEEVAHYNADMQGEVARASALIAPSRAHAELLAVHTGLPASGFRVLPPPTSVDWTRAPEPAWSPASDRPLRIAHWGRLGAGEGSDLLLAALQRIERDAEIELDLLGPAPQALDEEINALAQRTTVRRRRSLRAADLRELRADLAVLPAQRHDPDGRMLDAAIALGLPMIVSDRGALVERAGDGALAFPAGSAAGLANLLGRVLDGDVDLAKLRAGLPEPLSIDAHWRALVPIYTDAVARGPAPNTEPEPGLDDRERWERIARAYEDLSRDAVGLRGAAEREVQSLRRDVAGSIARMHEEIARATSISADVRSLRVRLAARKGEARELKARHAERAREALELEAINAQRLHEIRELEDAAVARLQELRGAEERLVAAEAAHARHVNGLQGELAGKQHEIDRLTRENRLAAPLVWPMRGVLWIWDRLKPGAANDRGEERSQ